MASNVTRRQTPEERELAAKKAELAALEIQLADRELEVATLRVELHNFEQRYIREVGVKFAEIDALEAHIAAVLSRLNPFDETARQRAETARAIARESAGATAEIGRSTRPVDFTPSDDLKRLYREIAKRIHPDLATDDSERAKRNQLMAEANRAYENGDEARLRAILDEWETSPDAITGDGVGAELVRIIRKIHQVQTRLARIQIDIAAMTRSELGVLKVRADSERTRGSDLLAQMAAQLDEQIVELKRKKDALS